MNIILACNAAMSTSMMKMRLEQETKNRGIEALVKAVPISELDDYKDTADVILLGPQVRYIEKKVKEQVSIPVLVMDMKDYGTMNAKKILDDALAAIG